MSHIISLTTRVVGSFPEHPSLDTKNSESFVVPHRNNSETKCEKCSKPEAEMNLTTPASQKFNFITSLAEHGIQNIHGICLQPNQRKRIGETQMNKMPIN